MEFVAHKIRGVSLVLNFSERLHSDKTTMSVDYVELKDLDDSEPMPEIKQSSLFHIHETQLSQDRYNDINTNQLVTTLGGIDAILSHYLSSQCTIQLSQLQLQNIQTIITSERNNDSNIIAEKAPLYTFKKSKTLIQQIANDSITDTLHNFVYSKTAACILATIGCILVPYWIYVSLIANPNDDNFNYIRLGLDIGRLLFEIIMLFWAIMIILTVNMDVFILSIKQFLFWFKLFQCIGFCITQWIIIGYFKIWTYTTLGTVAQIFFAIALFCFVMIICALDAFHAPRKLKIFLSLMFALLWTVATLETMMNPGREDLTKITVFKYWTFSVYSMYFYSQKILSVFFWKQTIFLIMYPNKCVNIRTTPYYKWE